MIKRIPILILCIFLLSVLGCSTAKPKAKTEQANQTVANQPITSSSTFGQLKVHFLDVGQADSIFVQMPNGQNMVIDAGNNDDGPAVVNYLKNAGVKKIDYLVGTHPHEDHIGGLDTVIRAFDIGQVLMPRVTTTTKTFEDVLKAVQAKGLKITPVKAGVEIVNADGLNVAVIAPHRASYENMNNYSAVLKITYGQVSFLLTGDAEEKSEGEMLAGSVVNPKADVLKVGHHGSRSSSTVPFLKAVNPKYAVICVGAGNDYGHPHPQTIQHLTGIETYRTDLNGTIVFSTDGKGITVVAEKTGKLPSTADSPQNSSVKAYVDSSGKGLIKRNINSKGEKIYHLPGRSYYDQTKPEAWFKTEVEAQAAGFRASMR